MTFSGWVADAGRLAGRPRSAASPSWSTGVITTAETASSVPASHIALTLIGYALVYALLLVSYMVVVTQLARKEAGRGWSRSVVGARRANSAA